MSSSFRNRTHLVVRYSGALGLAAVGTVAACWEAGLTACDTARAGLDPAGSEQAAPALLAPAEPSASARPRPETAEPAHSDPDPSQPDPSRGSKEARATAHQTTDCPEEMTAIEDYCVDRFEAHLVVRAPDGSLQPHPSNQRPDEGATHEARSRRGVLPQAYINRSEAAAACANAGKRLCTVSEWYRACQGPHGRTYPYGDRFARGKCNTGKPHLLSKLYGSDPAGWKYHDHFNNPELNRLDGFLAPAGSYSDCRSEEGTHDMVGNLHEWVSDPVDRSLAVKLPLLPKIRRKLRRRTGHGVFMGGFFSTTTQHGHGCGFVTIGHSARYHDYSTGFRCCADRASS